MSGLDPRGAPAVPADLRFPPGFLFGASSSAYQTEGGNEGSDLWAWEARMRGWERSGRASNSFAMWAEDVRCAKALGLGAYRFSVEWGRVFPAPGRADPAALAHYARLAEAIAQAGMRPIVCLHHFTNPRWLAASHPRLWADERVVDHFAAFADAVAAAVPVRDWIPFNEPLVYATQAHLTGVFPPGERRVLCPARAFLGGPVRNLALAHRRAHALLKRRDPACRVGVAHNMSPCYPLRPGRDDAAARRWDELFHWAFLDALALGRMDADLDGGRETVLGEGGTLDFVGVNYYSRVFVRRLPGALWPLNAVPLYADMTVVPWLAPLYRFLTSGRATRETDDMSRELYPEGLAEVLAAVDRRYGLPILVTESGAADATGRLRARHLLGHLGAARAAIDAGVRLEGFLYWSLLDNWEWGSFRPRFGLYRVDYENGFRREATEAARVYAEVIARSREAAPA
jgi:beta-glucosidase